MYQVVSAHKKVLVSRFDREPVEGFVQSPETQLDILEVLSADGSLLRVPLAEPFMKPRGLPLRVPRRLPLAEPWVSGAMRVSPVAPLTTLAFLVVFSVLIKLFFWIVMTHSLLA